jgi:hypothetical protein
VSPDFDTFLSEHRQIMDLRLAIPSVVRDELLFQQTTSALKALSRANEALDKVSQVTEKTYSHRVTEQRVRREVRERLVGWMEKVGAETLEVPLEHVNWSELIHAAIWRQPPFTFDAKDPTTEKGFRDALILETVVDFCSSTESDIAVVTGDLLLRNAAEKKFRELDHVALYESIDEFASYIRLAQENLTEEFVRSVRGKAKRKFFSRNDRDCVLIQERILERIRTEFEEDLRPEESLASSLLAKFGAAPEWEKTAERKVRLGSTQFDHLEEPRRFHWETEIVWAQGYKSEPAEELYSSLRAGHYLLVLTVGVKWSADVRSNGAFYDARVDDIMKKSRTFEPITDEARDQLGLRATN